MRLILGTTLLLALAATTRTEAALIVAGQTEIQSEAIQDITLLPGTPFNPLATNLVIENVTGVGSLVLNRSEQVGTTIEIPTLTGVFTGTDAMLGDFQFGTLTAAGQAEFSGSITNVVQNESDPGFATGDPSSFLSGDYQVGGDFFEFELLGSGAFFTTGAVTFNSEFDGLPPSPGTIISGGDDPVDILFNGAVVGFSTNRRIVAVPEPGAGLLVCLGALVSLRTRRRRVV